MESNKLLVMKNVAFNLPDNFEGNLTDALELLVKYRRGKESIKQKHVDNQPSIEFDNIGEAVFFIWNNKNYRCHIEGNVIEYKNDTWSSILDDTLEYKNDNWFNIIDDNKLK